jgi:DNA-binding NarL/FixJ family response regulator
MGGNAGGVETTFAITEVMPLVRVAVLTTDQDPQAKTVAAVRAGATGEIDKVEALEEAARVIRGVHAGWPVLSPMTWTGVAAEVAGWLTAADAVTDREDIILAALATGGSWEAATVATGLTELAARNQIRNVLARCRAAGYAEAADAALGAGLIAVG